MLNQNSFTEHKQVFITALEGFVPVDITKTLMAFLDFCYITRQDMLTDDLLDTPDIALTKFHYYRNIFQETNVHPTGFSLPHQHSLTHSRHTGGEGVFTWQAHGEFIVSSETICLPFTHQANVGYFLKEFINSPTCYPPGTWWVLFKSAYDSTQ